ncbi:transposase [Nitrospira sp. BLG_2]|uniref:transposase n=1 Tax=Nitrospira sp. BLG_2 TaxID=3397507 RepID=UPI003B9A60FA
MDRPIKENRRLYIGRTARQCTFIRNASGIKPKSKSIIRENISPESRMMTDEYQGYQGLKKEFADHQTTSIMDGTVYAEKSRQTPLKAISALLKRGLNGTYHHVSKHHLHRYLAEFDFRYNARHENDETRAIMEIRGAKEKRLMYR